MRIICLVWPGLSALFKTPHLHPLQHPEGTRHPVRCGEPRYGRGKWGDGGGTLNFSVNVICKDGVSLSAVL
jgi:hypothetical protein